MTKRILLLSAYHAASHDYWLQGLLKALPEYHWTVLTLPARYFNWRIRGNPLSWVSQESEALTGGYDLLIATSTVDVATLKGLVPTLATCPTAVYFHENQFAYPQSAQQAKHQRVEPQMVNLYAALAADALWFNSPYNRSSFLEGCRSLMRALPDHVPAMPWLDALDSRARVLPVPLNPVDVVERRPSQTLRLVWNHRWEYDKGIDGLCLAVDALCERGIKVELTLLGQRFRQCPEAAEALVKRLRTDRASVTLVENQFIESRVAYFELLARQDVVLSTALHDFQGLAIMDAVQAGCIPLVPDRLCYPDFFADEYLYASSPDSPESEAKALVDKLALWIGQPSSRPAVPDLGYLEWPQRCADYRDAIERCIEGRKQKG